MEKRFFHENRTVYRWNAGKQWLCDISKRRGKLLCDRSGISCRSFEECINRHQLHLSGILLTHHHYDHVGAVEKLRDRYDAPVFMHTADCDQYHSRVDVYLEDGDTIDLDGETIRVIHTPGHTRGGVCYFSEKSKVVFTGDTIFNVDIGRTDFEDGSPDQMERSILDKINTWPNDIFIYPGHGDGCTMKKVRQINTEFLDVVKGEEK